MPAETPIQAASTRRTAAGCIELAGIAVLVVCVAAAGTAFMACIGSLYGLAWMILACTAFVMRFRSDLDNLAQFRTAPPLEGGELKGGWRPPAQEDLSSLRTTRRLVRAMCWVVILSGAAFAVSLALSPYEFQGGARKHGLGGPLAPAFGGAMWWSLAANQCLLGGLLALTHMRLLRALARAMHQPALDDGARFGTTPPSSPPERGGSKGGVRPRRIAHVDLVRRADFATAALIAGSAFEAGLVMVLRLAGTQDFRLLAGPLAVAAYVCVIGSALLAVAGALCVLTSFKVARLLRTFPSNDLV